MSAECARKIFSVPMSDMRAGAFIYRRLCCEHMLVITGFVRGLPYVDDHAAFADVTRSDITLEGQDRTCLP